MRSAVRSDESVWRRLLCSPMRAGDASSPRCGVCLVPYLKPVGFDGVIRWEGGRPASGTMTPFFLSIFPALSGWRAVRTTCAVEDRLSRVASIRMAPFAALTTTPYFKRSTSTVVGWAKSEENQQ